MPARASTKSGRISASPVSGCGGFSAKLALRRTTGRGRLESRRRTPRGARGKGRALRSWPLALLDHRQPRVRPVERERHGNTPQATVARLGGTCPSTAAHSRGQELPAMPRRTLLAAIAASVVMASYFPQRLDGCERGESSNQGFRCASKKALIRRRASRAASSSYSAPDAFATNLTQNGSSVGSWSLRKPWPAPG